MANRVCPICLEMAFIGPNAKTCSVECGKSLRTLPRIVIAEKIAKAADLTIAIKKLESKARMEEFEAKMRGNNNG